MKIYLTFVYLATVLSLSQQTSDSTNNRVEEVVVKGNHSVLRSPRDDYMFFPGIGYYKLDTRFKSFAYAEVLCEAEGGHLAIINSVQEAQALITVYANSCVGSEYWPRLGFHDLLNKGDFRTIFGDPITSTGYSNWAPGEPGTPFEQNCGCMNKDGAMGTQCCDCDRWFFCEIELSDTDRIESTA